MQSLSADDKLPLAGKELKKGRAKCYFHLNPSPWLDVSSEEIEFIFT